MPPGEQGFTSVVRGEQGEMRWLADHLGNARGCHGPGFREYQNIISVTRHIGLLGIDSR